MNATNIAFIHGNLLDYAVFDEIRGKNMSREDYVEESKGCGLRIHLKNDGWDESMRTCCAEYVSERLMVLLS